MTAILGINFFSHDTAACLVVDGQPLVLVEQERINRDQHTKQLPDAAIDACLAYAGISASDLDAVAVAQRPLVDLSRGSRDALRQGSPKRLAAQVYTDTRLASRTVRFRTRWRYRGPLYNVGHHVAHAAGAFFAAPFDEAAVLTVDRGGDFLSTTLGRARATTLETLAAVANPHSLGELYTAVTVHLGFRAGADEGKVMGLAPYGTPVLVPAMRELVRLAPDGTFSIDLRPFGWPREAARPTGPLFDARFGPPRVPESEITDAHKDLAFAVQAVLEEAAVHIARALHRRTGLRRLCVSGGVALNSVMNRRLITDTGFEEIFVQPAASDAGNALGAALYVWHSQLGHRREWTMEHAYLGLDPTVSAPASAVADCFRRRGLSPRRCADPAAEAARLLAAGKVVGWYQGRAEIGPRALGARSILADPRGPDVRDIVNHRVKRREWFRPFAPSVLAERAHEWFDDYVANPFMLLVQPVRAERREVIPAVTHVDGTARLQTVTRQASPAYYDLISEFDRLTGVPMVLNTSFNLRGEPVVHTPDQALDDYLRSGMDAVVIGNLVAEKTPTVGRERDGAASQTTAG